MALSLSRASSLDRVIPAQIQDGTSAGDARPVSPKLVVSYAKRNNAAAKDENPTTLDGSLVVTPG
jgi:hypothetical protein